MDELGLQINATVMKEKAILANLPELMVQLGEKVSKINAHVLIVTRSLKQNGSSALNLLHQLFPANLAYPDMVFYAYIHLK